MRADDLVVVDVNDAYLTATGRARDSLVGRPVTAVFPSSPQQPGLTDRVEGHLREVVRSPAT